MPVFAGQRLQLSVSLQQLRNVEARPYIIRIQRNMPLRPWLAPTLRNTCWKLKPSDAADLPSTDSPSPASQPMGIAKAWCYINVQDSVWVYPTPQGRPLQPQYHAADGSGGRNSRQLSDQPHHLAITSAEIHVSKLPGKPAPALASCRFANTNRHKPAICCWTGMPDRPWIPKRAFHSYVYGWCRLNRNSCVMHYSCRAG